MYKVIKGFIHQRIAAFEREFDYDMGYGHEMLDISFGAFRRFSSVMGIAKHRESIPPAPWYAAKLAATLAEDCGPCTQLVVTMAEREGVSPEVLRAVLAGDIAAMGDDTALGWRFAHAVLKHAPDADALREQITARWGRKAVVSLALALLSGRMFPTVKYAMGFGGACMRVRVAGVETQPLRLSVAA